MAKFTLAEFKKQYPDDMACLDKIFQLRYAHLTECPKCGEPAAWRRVKTRRCYQCRHCYEQFYPTAGTVFEKTRTPLTEWFYVIFMFTTTRNGVAGHEIQRQLGCTIKCAFRMGHQIRKLMEDVGIENLKGFVELDETYVGKRERYKPGRCTSKKPVFGMVERLGNVKAIALDNVKKETIYPIIKNNIDESAQISTDEFNIYDNINSELGYTHGQIKHALKVYRDGWVTTNTIEGFFGQIKRMINGTHLHVSHKYLQNYVNECVMRYNYRKNQNIMFDTILKHLPLKSE